MPQPSARTLLVGASSALLVCAALSAQPGPEITSFRTNLNGGKGYSPDPTINAAITNVLADVQSVQYNANYSYISATTVPSYSIGPFNRNPNVPGNTRSVFRIPRNPRSTTTKTATGLGPIGVLVNGVPFFNALDARSYFNRGIWNQNAYIVEGPSFDTALGHPAPGRGGARAAPSRRRSLR